MHVCVMVDVLLQIAIFVQKNRERASFELKWLEAPPRLVVLLSPPFSHLCNDCEILFMACIQRLSDACLSIVSCPDPPRTCEKEGLVTQVQILGLASEFESGQ